MSKVVQNISNLPTNLQPIVALWLEHLGNSIDTLPDEVVEPLSRLLACSEFGGKVLLRDFPWFVDAVASFFEPPDETELAIFADQLAASDVDTTAAKAQLRQFRNRRLVHVLWRELQQLADLDETLTQLSQLADRLLDAAMRYSERQLEPRFGRPRNASGEVIPMVIIGMGKLGGRELNFSSDIDIIFTYPEDGETDGDRVLAAHEYFTRLSRQIIALIGEVTVDGFVQRVDTRLRPFGDSGPPVSSFAALESYLLQHGRGWERYAYVKARVVGTRPSDAVMQELTDELIRPFVYRRYLDYGVFASLREMQGMIAAEVRRRDLTDNIKLGAGGIREIEFIVQALQLVRGGSEPTLQRRQLQAVLPLLVSERGVTASAAASLRSAYRYLRRLENFIQAIRDEQTHDLPNNDIDRSRLCLAMNCDSWRDLLEELNGHRGKVVEQFNVVAFRGGQDAQQESSEFQRLWDSTATESEWSDALQVVGKDDAADMARTMLAFAKSAATQKIDSISRSRLQRFVPILLGLVVESERPAAALSRTLTLCEHVLRRSAYLALLIENRPALSRLVDLCGRSQYIADRITRHPALLDELLDPEIYSDGVIKEDLARALHRRLEVVDIDDSELRMQTIARFQRSTMFRIAVADFNDKLPIMKVSDDLTWLAEVVLDQALRVAWRDVASRHGVPQYLLESEIHDAGFGIVAYGKLGGLELSYGSDLDIVFLHDSKGDKQVSNGAKPLDNTVFFGRLVRRLVHCLSIQTASGALYEIDTRLRPDGRSGVLVTSTEAFERYQEGNAWTWEHQALLRTRAVAGSDSIAKEFERIRNDTLISRVRRESLHDDVVSMRKKMRKELDRSDSTTFDLKHGAGGIGDIEFLVQFLVLREARSHSDVIAFSDNIRQLDALIAAKILSADDGGRLQSIYRDYRLCVHRLVLDGQKALVDASAFSAEREFVAGIWAEHLG